jgi:hypothetical protein
MGKVAKKKCWARNKKWLDKYKMGGGGGNEAEVCREFGLVNFAIETIWKGRTKIINEF